MTFFAASHTIDFGRLRVEDRYQGTFVEETTSQKPASHSEPRISELTYGSYSTYPITDLRKTFSLFQLSSQHPSVHAAYDALRSNTDQLPTPNIRKFDGNPLDHWAFFNQFRYHVANQLSSRKKLSYLLHR